MNRKELQFISDIYDSLYNGYFISKTDLNRFKAILKRMQELSNKHTNTEV